MELDPRTPVIVGVGQTLNKSDADETRLDSPIALAVRAARLAADDAGAPQLLKRLDVVASARMMTWGGPDAARLIADDLGATNASTWYPQFGGNSPQMLVTKASAAIASGEADLVVVCGAEAARARRARREKPNDSSATHQPPWPHQDDAVVPDWRDYDEAPPFAHPAELALGIVLPTTCYPIFETALWHESGRTLAAHLDLISAVWARYAQVAATNPFAWDRSAPTATEISVPTPDNRMVAFPYTKRMVSNPYVDMASAILLCSLDTARMAGIDHERMVFPLSGTDGHDSHMSERPDFVSSAAIRVAGNAAVQLADTTIEEIEHLDVYSCFPSAVQIACRELGIPLERSLTTWGGLPFGGGPWNNPVGHAIASMVDTLRRAPGQKGLVTANGGIVEKHAFGVYSTQPPTAGFRHSRPQFAIDQMPGRLVDADYEGDVVIEAFTVVYDPAGPQRAVVAALTPGGARTWCESDDPEVMSRLMAADLIGTSADVDAEHRLHLSH